MNCMASTSFGMGDQHAFQAEGVFTDVVPETSYDHYWLGDHGATTQKFRIGFSCPKIISSVSMRNSGLGSDPLHMGPGIKYKNLNDLINISSSNLLTYQGHQGLRS